MFIHKQLHKLLSLWRAVPNNSLCAQACLFKHPPSKSRMQHQHKFWMREATKTQRAVLAAYLHYVPRLLTFLGNH